MLQDNSFFQLVTQPTRGSNILGLILTTNENLVENIEVTDDEAVSLQSDHKAILFNCLTSSSTQNLRSQLREQFITTTKATLQLLENH
jgi:hypothetical protein